MTPCARGLSKIKPMNTIHSTTIDQDEDYSLTLHIVINNDVVDHHYEAVTPESTFMDEEMLIANMYMFKKAKDIQR